MVLLETCETPRCCNSGSSEQAMHCAALMVVLHHSELPSEAESWGEWKVPHDAHTLAKLARLCRVLKLAKL